MGGYGSELLGDWQVERQVVNPARRGETEMKASFETFLWAVVLGMGFRVGWGLIGLIIWAAAKAVGSDAPFLH
jgi:hypothetical protein